MRGHWSFGAALAFPAGLCSLGCEDVARKSADHARVNVAFVADAAKSDVAQVRAGLPQGAGSLTELFKRAHPEVPGPEAASVALERARNRVQELRLAKSTFFALVLPDGRIVKNDQEQDLMVGKNFYQAFPELKAALDKPYAEARGAMPEAAGVRGKPDGQWVAQSPIREGAELRGAYVTGWSWSAYAYRLETGLRSKILSETDEGGKIPLLYVFVVVDQGVYGAPVTPAVNAKAVGDLKPLEHLGNEPWSTTLEIERRKFGLAVLAVSELGAKVAVAVLRSET